MKLRIIISAVAVLLIAVTVGLVAKSISHAKMTNEPDSNTARVTDSPTTVEVNPEAPAKSETAPLAEARCFCRAKSDIGQSPASVPDPCIDWGTIDPPYTGGNPQKEENQKNCAKRCSEKASQDANFNNDNWVCGNCFGKAGGYDFIAYSKVGTKDWRVAQTNPVNCCATGGVITCPSGWQEDPYNMKCKRDVCTVPQPCPTNNTLIGQWGFTWGCTIVQWGPATNITPVVIKSCN